MSPMDIPPAVLSSMSQRGRGNYSIGISICAAATAPGRCSALGEGYVAILNASGCVNAFNKPIQRPTAITGGFSVKYQSATNTKDIFELMVICNPLQTSDELVSRSKKFATYSP